MPLSSINTATSSTTSYTTTCITTVTSFIYTTNIGVVLYLAECRVTAAEMLLNCALINQRNRDK